MMSRILASLVVCAVLSPFTLAQATGDRIDLYFNDWHSSTPRTTLGSLQERDIFTKGDPHNPAISQFAHLRHAGAESFHQGDSSRGTAGSLLHRVRPRFRDRRGPDR